MYLFIHLFIYSLVWNLKGNLYFLKTQVTKETEKLKARIEIEERKSNSSRHVTVSNEYFHFFFYSVSQFWKR